MVLDSKLQALTAADAPCRAHVAQVHAVGACCGLSQGTLVASAAVDVRCIAARQACGLQDLWNVACLNDMLAAGLHWQEMQGAVGP